MAKGDKVYLADKPTLDAILNDLKTRITGLLNEIAALTESRESEANAAARHEDVIGQVKSGGRHLSSKMATVQTPGNGVKSTVLNLTGAGEFYALWPSCAMSVTITVDGIVHTIDAPSGSFVYSGVGVAGWGAGKLLNYSNSSISPGYTPIKFGKSLKVEVHAADGGGPVHAAYAVYE